MSKKKKKRLNKKLIEERLRELETETKESKVIKPAEKTKETPRTEEKKPNQKDQLILKDVKRVGIVALIMLAIFVALFFLNLKTDCLLKASNEILNLLHVGQF